MSVSKLFADLRKSKSKRVARGAGSGKGKTAGKGHKGQKARSGAGRKITAWFEGGQTPLSMRTAKKRGFKSIRVKPYTLTTAKLNLYYKDGETVDLQSLIEKNIVKKNVLRGGVKLVKNRELTVKVKISPEIKTSKSL